MEKYEIEERLHKVFKNSLDMKAQWIFKIQEYNTHGIFNNLRCYGFFSQRFKWQSLQSCHLGIRNFIKFGMYPFRKYIFIRESSHEQCIVSHFL